MNVFKYNIEHHHEWMNKVWVGLFIILVVYWMFFSIALLRYFYYWIRYLIACIQFKLCVFRLNMPIKLKIKELLKWR